MHFSSYDLKSQVKQMTQIRASSYRPRTRKQFSRHEGSTIHTTFDIFCYVISILQSSSSCPDAYENVCMQKVHPLLSLLSCLTLTCFDSLTIDKVLVNLLNMRGNYSNFLIQLLIKSINWLSPFPVCLIDFCGWHHKWLCRSSDRTGKIRSRQWIFVGVWRFFWIVIAKSEGTQMML
jgi:hypothetical protein